MSGFVDNERIQQLIEKLKGIYLEMGMTVLGHQVMVDEHGDPIIQVAAVVRETAYELLSQDLDVRKSFAKQMAEENQRSIDRRVDAIREAAESGDLLGILTGDRELIQCSHERVHEGLCLDCGEEFEDG